MSGAQRHTHFLDSPRIAQVVGGSDFSFADLKNEVATVFLILPPDRLDTYSRWLRNRSMKWRARPPTTGSRTATCPSGDESERCCGSDE